MKQHSSKHCQTYIHIDDLLEESSCGVLPSHTCHNGPTPPDSQPVCSSMASVHQPLNQSISTQGYGWTSRASALNDNAAASSGSVPHWTDFSAAANSGNSIAYWELLLTFVCVWYTCMLLTNFVPMILQIRCVMIINIFTSLKDLLTLLQQLQACQPPHWELAHSMENASGTIEFHELLNITA